MDFFPILKIFLTRLSHFCSQLHIVEYCGKVKKKKMNGMLSLWMKYRGVHGTVYLFIFLKNIPACTWSNSGHYPITRLVESSACQSRPATEAGAEHGGSTPESLSAWKELWDDTAEHFLSEKGWSSRKALLMGMRFHAALSQFQN